MENTFVIDRNAAATDSRKFRGTVPRLRGSRMNVAMITQEYRDIVPRLLREERRTAKVIALRVESTPRTVENWREGLNGPSVPHFIALAREIPALRQKVLEWLDASTGDSEESPEKLAADIARFLAERGRS